MGAITWGPRQRGEDDENFMREAGQTNRMKYGGAAGSEGRAYDGGAISEGKAGGVGTTYASRLHAGASTWDGGCGSLLRISEGKISAGYVLAREGEGQTNRTYEAVSQGEGVIGGDGDVRIVYACDECGCGIPPDEPEPDPVDK